MDKQLYLFFPEYLDLLAVLVDNYIQVESVVVFTTLMIIATLVGFMYFKHRDFSV